MGENPLADADMSEATKQRFAIQSYRTKLGDFLNTRHGNRASYTTEQVRQGASELGLDLILICYAFAMFCTRDAFTAHHAATGRHCDYDSMQAEIAAVDLSGSTADPDLPASELDSHEADFGVAGCDGPDVGDV